MPPAAPDLEALRPRAFAAGYRMLGSVAEAEDWVTINGHPGRILRDASDDVWDVLAIDVVDGRIEAVRIVRNPDKLRHL